MMKLIQGSQKFRGDIPDEAVEQRNSQVDSRMHQVEECHIPNFGSLKFSLTKPKFEFGFGSSDLGTSIFSHSSETPRLPKYLSFL